MLKQEECGSGGGVGGRSSNWLRSCDTCRSSPSTVYCRADSAYLCTSCDAHIHAVNNLASRHERVWVCESCRRAPSALLCKADAASLCTTCDSHIHSANSLASRHQRVPISPIPAGILYGPPAAAAGTGRSISRFHHIIGHYSSEDDGFLNNQEEETIIDEDDATANSWMLLLNPSVKNHHHHHHQGNNTSGMQFDGEVVDEYLDLGDYNNNNSSNQENQYNIVDDSQQHHYEQQQQYNHGDSVVPAGAVSMTESNHDQSYHLGLQFQTYPLAAAAAAVDSTSLANQVVAVSCMDVVVPETGITDFSHSQPRTPKGTIDLFSSHSIQMPLQLNPMDREARVLRYREKKKARKFEKTIRYASRKAYAETRPRIKGRFAKRTNVDDVEVDQVLSESTAAYSVVPSF